jgi:hypothetical protein
VQNDEANPSLYGIVNQMTAGHEYLLQNFGVQPRIAWQLDPFGHSSVSPTLFALMGFDALVINRIHFSEKVRQPPPQPHLPPPLHSLSLPFSHPLVFLQVEHRLI